MAHLDVDWCAATTTIPFDPAITDGLNSSFAVWPPFHIRTTHSLPTVCEIFGTTLFGSPTSKKKKQRIPTVHLGHARHVDRIEIFWEAFSREDPTELLHGLFLPHGASQLIEVVAQSGERAILAPVRKKSMCHLQNTTKHDMLRPTVATQDNSPPRTLMMMVRMGYEHSGSRSVYQVPSHLKKQMLQVIVHSNKINGIPIRQIKVSPLCIALALFYLIFYSFLLLLLFPSAGSLCFVSNCLFFTPL